MPGAPAPAGWASAPPNQPAPPAPGHPTPTTGTPGGYGNQPPDGYAPPPGGGTPWFGSPQQAPPGAGGFGSPQQGAPVPGAPTGFDSSRGAPGTSAPAGFGYPPPGAPPGYHNPSPIRTAPGEERLSLEKRQQLDLRKQAVAKVLLTKGAQGARARIVLVIDKTGSMTSLYRKGVLKRVVQRMIPVAIQLDDDGRLEPYLYANKFAALPPVTVDRADEWCDTFLHLSGKRGGIDYGRIGAVNNEIPIMREIMDTLDPAADPTLVLFFTDGGFHEKRKITALMREASTLPIFWQFIGLGRADYGILRALDTMDGRVVDNAGFFAVDDIDRTTDDNLYQRLLGEFPDWLIAARAAGILR
ncbi:VWA domain-containing protein [Nocardia sp. NEAU-351]|uniref:VWA domain-containing protein n=1 Tax=Nocardia bovistercoris TaxID=2785916 RepID=A0A931N5M6_9NOCA|nr:VWA domain-containing protein [Nocardia bovistercoris]